MKHLLANDPDLLNDFESLASLSNKAGGLQQEKI